MPAPTNSNDTRRDWLSVLATSAPDRLAALLPDIPDHEFLRTPETGTVMVQGRISATGAPFNLAEMTITRCAIRMACGTVGHGHVQGRSRAHARRVAVLDALLQLDADRHSPIIDALRHEAQQIRTNRAAKAAATRVEFFTLQRGEDA